MGVVKKRDLRVTDMSIIDPLDTVEPHFIESPILRKEVGRLYRKIRESVW